MSEFEKLKAKYPGVQHQGIIGNMQPFGALLVMELVYQIYEDGNLFEWFCDVSDVDPEAARPTFAFLHLYMKNGMHT